MHAGRCDPAAGNSSSSSAPAPHQGVACAHSKGRKRGGQERRHRGRGRQLGEQGARQQAAAVGNGPIVGAPPPLAPAPGVGVEQRRRQAHAHHAGAPQAPRLRLSLPAGRGSPGVWPAHTHTRQLALGPCCPCCTAQQPARAAQPNNLLLLHSPTTCSCCTAQQPARAAQPNNLLPPTTALDPSRPARQRPQIRCGIAPHALCSQVHVGQAGQHVGPAVQQAVVAAWTGALRGAAARRLDVWTFGRWRKALQER
jgi:hypothetical protein